MNKEQVKNELIIPNLKQGEELVGFFQAQYISSFWWVFLVGPLYYLSQRIYFVAVTDKGLHFHKFTFWGKPDAFNYFSWEEIVKLKLGKGLLQAPFELVFNNGRKLKLRAYLKGNQKSAKLDDRTKEYLLSKSI